MLKMTSIMTGFLTTAIAANSAQPMNLNLDRVNNNVPSQDTVAQLVINVNTPNPWERERLRRIEEKRREAERLRRIARERREAERLRRLEWERQHRVNRHYDRYHR
jgi:hypothetical protein